MVRRGAFVALGAIVLGCVLIAVSGCGESTATVQPSRQASSLATQTTPGWARVGISRVMGLSLRPGRPAAIEFQVTSPELQIFALTQKPLTGHVLFLRSPGPAGSSEDTLTAVPMQTLTRSIGGFGYIFTAISVKPGPYRLILKGKGSVFTVEVKQR
jgi:hypothetical protein